MAAHMKISLKKILFLILGTFSLILGIAGVFFPVLPTTPFLLLACFFYLRSSNRLYKWLTTHRIFGSYIYNYMTYRAITRKAKLIALSFLWSALIISIILVSSPAVRLLLFAVGIGVSIHLLTIKTLSNDALYTSEVQRREPENVIIK